MTSRTSLSSLRAVAILVATAAPAAFASAGDTTMTTELVASGDLVRPVFATHAPGDTTRLYILEKRGIIRVLNLKTGVLAAEPFLDLDALVGGGTMYQDERGLLGLAFHPDYQENGQFFVNYTDAAFDTTVSRYTVTTPDVADPDSASILLFIDQPFPSHNAGWLGFGPNDGYLYIATGDGGSACDNPMRAQDITDQLLGKILRIDVDGGAPYAIPASNPFVGIEGDDEIWAFGLRNPWRASFDRATGDLYIADVGQYTWEEIDVQPAASPGGTNYGWECTEGLVCLPPGCGEPAACACDDDDLVDPVHVYDHTAGCSVIGGYVYRGCAMPEMQGTYFFGDFCAASVWSFVYDGGVTQFTDRTAELDPPGTAINQVSSFGEDARGEIYVCDQGGEVFRIRPLNYQPRFEDIDCDLEVAFTDLLALLAGWGPCDGCAADVNGDGEVTFADLLQLLAAWGPIR